MPALPQLARALLAQRRLARLGAVAGVATTAHPRPTPGGVHGQHEAVTHTPAERSAPQLGARRSSAEGRQARSSTGLPARMPTSAPRPEYPGGRVRPAWVMGPPVLTYLGPAHRVAMDGGA